MARRVIRAIFGKYPRKAPPLAGVRRDLRRLPRRHESSSMRTSKNRSSRARYTCAGWATGRSGRVAVLLCFVSLFCSVLLFLYPLPSSFHLPAYRARSPFLPVRASLSLAAAHSRELLFDCFITFINTAATMPLLLLLARSRLAGRLLCWSTEGPIVARGKMRILI